MEAVTLYDRPQSTMSATSMFLIHRLDRLDYKLELWKTALDAVDGSRNRHRDVPPCGCCRRVVRVRLWLTSEVPAPSRARPLYPQLRTFAPKTSAFSDNRPARGFSGSSQVDPFRSYVSAAIRSYFVSSNNALASFESGVSKPSVKSLYIGVSRSRASAVPPCSSHRRAKPTAASAACRSRLGRSTPRFRPPPRPRPNSHSAC